MKSKRKLRQCFFRLSQWIYFLNPLVAVCEDMKSAEQ